MFLNIFLFMLLYLTDNAVELGVVAARRLRSPRCRRRRPGFACIFRNTRTVVVVVGIRVHSGSSVVFVIIVVVVLIVQVVRFVRIFGQPTVLRLLGGFHIGLDFIDARLEGLLFAFDRILLAEYCGEMSFCMTFYDSN